MIYTTTMEKKVPNKKLKSKSLRPRYSRYTWNDIQDMCNSIIYQLVADKWIPDIIVGVCRGGLVPATIISHRTDVMMYSLDVRLRDVGPDNKPILTSDCALSEDAYNGKNILIVDDINDTGATFNWIKEDWPSNCHPDDPKWDSVWGSNVRFATLVENMHSDFSDVSYYYAEVNKSYTHEWYVFPWEWQDES